MGRRKAAASRKARARIAPLTATGTVQDITASSSSATRSEARGARGGCGEQGELLQILGLADQLNKPIPPSARSRAVIREAAVLRHYLGLRAGGGAAHAGSAADRPGDR